MRPPPPRRGLLGTARPGRRVALAAGCATLVLAGGVVASLAVGGYRRSDVLLSSGTVWLASPGGLVTLVDGPSEQVVGNVQTQALGGVPDVVQIGNSALVVDQQGGTLTRIDGATYALTGPKQVGQGGRLQVLPSGSAAFAVDGQGGVSIVDTRTLDQRHTVALPVRPGDGQVTVDSAGRLWAEDAGGGGLARVDPSGAVTRFPGVGDAASRLVTSQGRPALVDAAGGRIGWIDDSGAVPTWQCTGLRLGRDPQLLGAGSGPVYASVPDTGRLVVADLASRRCTSTALAGPGAGLGRPVADDGFVLVPDRNQGLALVVDPTAGAVVAREPVGPPGEAVDLVAKDGLVFFNDATGPDAGVVRFQGGQWVAGPPVAKFSAGSAVPDLAAATALASSQSLQGLPPPPGSSSAPPTTPRTSARTTAARTAATTTTTPPTTTWPKKSSSTPPSTTPWSGSTPPPPPPTTATTIRPPINGIPPINRLPGG